MARSNRPRHYFGFHYLLMRVLGLGWWHHPEEGDTRNFPGWYLYYAIITELVWVVGFVGLETIDPFIGEKDIDRFMFSLSFVITHDLTLIKLYIIFFRNAELQETVRTLEVDLQSYYQNHDKTRKTINLSRILTGSFIFFGWLTIGNASIYGAVQDLKWRKEVALLNDSAKAPDRALPQPIYIPWNYQKDISYFPTFALETIGLLWTGHIVMTIDTMIGSIILHMSSQFSVFQEAVVTAYDRTIGQLYEHIPITVEGNQLQSKYKDEFDKYDAVVREKYSVEEIEKALENTLRNCFRQHQLLISREFASVMTQSDRPRHYFCFHYLLLRALGLGWWHYPEEGDTRNFPGWYLYYSIITGLVWVVGFVGLETINPFIGEKDLDRFMFSLSFVITHDLTMIKLYLFFFRNADLQDVVRTLEIDLQSFYQNHAKTRATVRITRILTGSFIFFGWLTIGNASIYGAVQDLKWRKEVALLNDSVLAPDRALPQPIYIPWNYQKDISYFPTFALETIGLLWTGHIVMTIDTMISSIILHMSSQFSVFQEAVVTAYDRTIGQLYGRIPTNVEGNQLQSKYMDELDKYEEVVQENYSEEEIGKALEVALRNCFRQHQILINCVQKFGRTYAYGFMTQLLSSMAAICVVMVQVSNDASSFKSVRLVTSLSFFVAMTLQLVLQCFTANELTIQAGRVANAVMESKWERMPVRLRRMLLLMMMRAQRPLVLSAAGFANMDNACFLAIMKAAYSYYAVLSQKQNTTH